MAGLSFLNNATVEEVKATKRSGGGRAKQWNPNPLILAIRLWKDGSVFPSQALVDKFDLNYRTTTIEKKEIPLKEGETEQKYKNEYFFIGGQGNGFDVIDSRVWPGYKADGHMLFISPIERSEAKVDLFSRVDYDENGDPKTSVSDQGSPTYGKNVLLNAVKELYGIELTDEKQYVDLVVFEQFEGINITEQFSKPLSFFPKTVSRGEEKGKSDVIRRENAKVYGFAPAEVLGVTTETNDDLKDGNEGEENQADTDQEQA